MDGWLYKTRTQNRRFSHRIW